MLLADTIVATLLLQMFLYVNSVFFCNEWVLTIKIKRLKPIKAKSLETKAKLAARVASIYL